MKKYIIPIIVLLLGIICLIAYKVIGSEVSADGTLVEQFWLIPVGYLLIVISIISSIVIYINSVIKKK